MIAAPGNSRVIALEPEFIVPQDGREKTVLQAYITQYLRTHPGIHQDKMVLLVRALEPTAKGLPLEVYAFTQVTEWEKNEAIQSEIFHQLITAVPQFDLRLFQEPSGLDFQAFAKELIQK